jgi:hypothetical protein
MKTITLPYEEYQEMQNEIERLKVLLRKLKQNKTFLLYEDDNGWYELTLTKDYIDNELVSTIKSRDKKIKNLIQEYEALIKEIKNKRSILNNFIWWTK